MIIATDDVRHDAPAHPDPDRRWSFALVAEGMTWFGDSLSELVGALIPGYTQMDDDDALGARWLYAVSAADVVQQVLAARTGVDTASEDDLQVLMATRSVPVEVEQWNAPIPLVLLRTDYAPFTERPAPTGAVHFVDPSTERELLASLSALGAVQLLVASGH